MEQNEKVWKITWERVGNHMGKCGVVLKKCGEQLRKCDGEYSTEKCVVKKANQNPIESGTEQ
jgi:hypothetical protein